MEIVIKAKLALAVQLVDASTNRPLQTMEVMFYKNDILTHPLYRGDATWVFLGEDRENFRLCVKARDFEVTESQICYDNLDARLPMCEIFLIPSENNRQGAQVLGVFGSYPGLTAIDAVLLSRPMCMFRDCAVKRKVITMTIFPANAGTKAVLEKGTYVLLSEDGKSYENFTVVRQDAPNTAVILAELSRAYRADCRIYRPIYGRASPDGSFLFRYREDGADLAMLLRFKAFDKYYFRPLDLRSEKGEIDLSEGAWELPVPSAGKEDTENE